MKTTFAVVMCKVNHVGDVVSFSEVYMSHNMVEAENIRQKMASRFGMFSRTQFFIVVW